MSDRSSQDAEASTSASTTPASTSSGRASKTKPAEQFSAVTGLPSLLPPTCARSTPDSLASMCSPEGFPARMSATLASALVWLSGLAQAFGTSSPAPFAYYDPESSSWRTSQVSLLEDSTSSSPTWPKWGTTAAGAASEPPTSALPTDASASSLLLPTPRVASERSGRGAMVENQQWSSVALAQALEIARGELPREFRSWDEVPGELGIMARENLLPTPMAYESTPTEEFVEEIREHLDPDDPDHRLWLPGRRWMTQRTLSRVAPALLPTPDAWLGRRPENSMADPEREASRRHVRDRRSQLASRAGVVRVRGRRRQQLPLVRLRRHHVQRIRVPLVLARTRRVLAVLGRRRRQQPLDLPQARSPVSRVPIRHALPRERVRQRR